VKCASVLYAYVTKCYSMGLGPLPPFGGGGAGVSPTSPAAPVTPNATQGTDTPASPGTETTASSTPATTTTTSTTAGPGSAPSQASNPQQDVFSQFMARMVCIYLLTYSVPLVHKRTILTERPPLVGEVSANFCG
jgi:hypothetical protein